MNACIGKLERGAENEFQVLQIWLMRKNCFLNISGCMFERYRNDLKNVKKNTKGVPNPRFEDFERMENIWNTNLKRFRGTQDIWKACFESLEVPKAPETAKHAFREIRTRQTTPKRAFRMVWRHQTLLKRAFREVWRHRTPQKRTLWPTRKHRMPPKRASLEARKHRTHPKREFGEARRLARLEWPEKKAHKVCVQIWKTRENVLFLQCFEKTDKTELKRMWKSKALWRGHGNARKRVVFNTFLKSGYAKTIKKQTRNRSRAAQKTQ